LQKHSQIIQQLDDELKRPNHRMDHRFHGGPALYQDLDSLRSERERLIKDNQQLRDTIRDCESRLDSQRQTLESRDESIKKLLEMLQSKAPTSNIRWIEEEFRSDHERTRQRLFEAESRARRLEENLQMKQREMSKIKEVSSRATCQSLGSSLVLWNRGSPFDY
jgi:chromosome segregation ATPase